MKGLKFNLIFLFVLLLAACATVPLTGRKQLSLVDESQIQQEATQAYKQFLGDPKTKVIKNSADAQRVKSIGNKIASAIDRYMRENGYGDQYNYNWEFNLVESKEINAWCMPGGKVAVYTGILPVTATDAGLATVMGHEIAHAIAHHASERASQMTAAQLGGGVVGVASGGSEIIGQLYGLGGQLALLKYSRNQESEADRLGLIFMAMAGYNPAKAIDFWQRMASAKEGSGAPPEFLSTHPSDETRIRNLQKRLPEAQKYYKP
ncbi:M48 family metallopeptidase [Rubrolithibacter danxiaensis]|uniref:M48 family metallopeptidase n=1 Tax=Rubrolithibacter danxiaensis TaxID=3390805 RepID=UPI003BF7C649